LSHDHAVLVACTAGLARGRRPRRCQVLGAGWPGQGGAPHLPKRPGASLSVLRASRRDVRGPAVERQRSGPATPPRPAAPAARFGPL